MYLQFAGFGTYLIDGEMPYKVGRASFGMSPPYGPIRAKDGDVMTIFGTDPLWPEFCKLAGLEHLAHDPRFENDEARRQHAEEIGLILDEAFSKKTRAEWQQIFKEAKMRCDPCLTYAELCAHPQTEANGMICTVNHPVRGEIKMLGTPVKLKKTPGRPQGPSPLLGQHTEEILLKLGYTAKDIANLEAQGVIKITRKK